MSSSRSSSYVNYDKKNYQLHLLFPPLGVKVSDGGAERGEDATEAPDLGSLQPEY